MERVCYEVHEKPGSVSNERETSQGLEDEILMFALQVQPERNADNSRSDVSG